MNNAESLWRMEVVGNFNRLRERAAQFLSLQFDDSEQRCSFLGSSFVEGNSEMPRLLSASKASYIYPRPSRYTRDSSRSSIRGNKLPDIFDLP